MVIHGSIHACLAAAAVLGLAPAPRAADVEKYLPDRTSFVAVVDVKQVVAWPPF
jgi:hypothetical protein